MTRRWSKLIKDFHSKKGLFDISKIPDIYDNIKYDLQHNQAVIEFEHAEPLHAMSKAMADLVIPQVRARHPVGARRRVAQLFLGLWEEYGSAMLLSTMYMYDLD